MVSSKLLYALLLMSIIWIFSIIFFSSSPPPKSKEDIKKKFDCCSDKHFSILDYMVPERDHCTREDVLNCYAVYHKRVITGVLPPHFMVAYSGTNLGWGNRLEQSLTTLFMAFLTGRAFIMNWPTTPSLSTFLNSTNFHVNYDWSVTENYKYNDPVDGEVTWTNLPVEHFDSELVEGFLSHSDFTQDISRKPVVTTELNVFYFPFDNIYNGPYQHAIPKILGNWKKTLMEYFFIVTDPVLKRVENFKKKMNSYPNLVGLQIRTFGNPSQTNPQVLSLWGCVDYFMSNNFDNPNIKLFLATDAEAHKEECSRKYPTRCYYSDIPAAHLAGDVELGSDKRDDIRSMENIMFDWWMFGEVDFAVVFAASSFGYTALDRSDAYRFIVGGLTQCVDSTDLLYYFEKIYVPLLVSYNKTGAMKYYPLQ